jgi:hypothetical protein
MVIEMRFAIGNSIAGRPAAARAWRHLDLSGGLRGGTPARTARRSGADPDPPDQHPKDHACGAKVPPMSKSDVLRAIQIVYGLQNGVGAATYLRSADMPVLIAGQFSPEIHEGLKGGDRDNARLLMWTRVLMWLPARL